MVLKWVFLTGFLKFLHIFIKQQRKGENIFLAGNKKIFPLIIKFYFPSHFKGYPLSKGFLAISSYLEGHFTAVV